MYMSIDIRLIIRVCVVTSAITTLGMKEQSTKWAKHKRDKRAKHNSSTRDERAKHNSSTRNERVKHNSNKIANLRKIHLIT